MIKIRLHGEKQEIEKVSKAIKEQFNVLNESHLYKDRGESVYYRAYIDAEIKESNIPLSPEIVPKIKVAKTCAVVDAELKESKTLQGLVCCDKNLDKTDCIACPYFEEEDCEINLLFDCKDYIAKQIRKENQK